MKKRWMTAVAAALVLVVAAPALAGTIKVPKDYDTIQEAVDNADDGDKILVSKGVYNEQVVVTGKHNLQIIGKGAIWDGGDDGVQFLANGNGILIQGFTFRNGDVQVGIFGDGAVVRKCKSTGAKEHFVYLRGPDGGTDISDGGRVESCQVIDCLGAAVRLHVDDAVVVKCKFDAVHTNAVLIEGDDALVEKCQVKRAFVAGIRIGGENAVVQSNKLSYCRIKGITVSGDNPTILKNTVTGGCTATAIDLHHTRDVSSGGPFNFVGGLIEGNKVTAVAGSGVRSNWGTTVTIRGNKMKDGGNDGIACSTDEAIIEGNSVQGYRGRGLVIFADDVDAISNSIKKAGGGCDGAVTVEGSGNLLEDISVVDWAGDGSQISGASNELVDCLASKCSQDGFDIETVENAPVPTDGTVIEDCTATGCGAEGLDNSGTNTDVSGSAFLKNLLDVVNNGSFANFGANFQSGGESTEPQFECDDYTHSVRRTTLDGVANRRYFNRPDSYEVRSLSDSLDNIEKSLRPVAVD